jgi:HPt (histidine-containing phosphotransfer) domain-containing protein
MPTPSEPEFDWSQAESLLGEDPNQVPEDMAEIVLELVQGAKERFQELKAFNPETDRVPISALAHQLRGSLLNFGFVGVGAVLFEIEKLPYESADYPGLTERAESAFVSSLRLLAERYPSLRLA